MGGSGINLLEPPFFCAKIQFDSLNNSKGIRMATPTGIHRMLQSGYWINTVFPDLKKKYPIDAGKIEKEQAGVQRPLPAGDFAKGVVEEIRRHPLVEPPSTNFGIWDKPTVMLHAANGGVEYQSEQVKYFGSAMCDLNSPVSWDAYKAKATQVGLKTVDWRHVHTYEQIQQLLDVIKQNPLKTGGVNLESVVFEGLSVPRIADMIDSTLGTDCILAIPTMGWVDGIDWSALSRHVFQLEFFLNDPPPDWVGLPDVILCKQLAEHARNCGIRKFTMVCGIYDASSYNANARNIPAAQYKSIIAQAGERFGGIYLGDNNGSNYSQWA
jgi:hypothetical protein